MIITWEHFEQQKQKANQANKKYFFKPAHTLSTDNNSKTIYPRLFFKLNHTLRHRANQLCCCLSTNKSHFEETKKAKPHFSSEKGSCTP